MSNNFLSEIFKDLNSESSVSLPNAINIVDAPKNSHNNMYQTGGDTTSEFNSSFIHENASNLSATSNTSMFIPQKEGSYDDNATSSFIPQKGGSYDDNATSSFIPQKGGSFDDNSSSSLILQKGGSFNNNSTSSVLPSKRKLFNTNSTSSVLLQKGGNNNDVNHLISMLTTDSNNKNDITNSTNTEELENRLRNML
jgi:hypothetical protein